jgi:hypothetical protein
MMKKPPGSISTWLRKSGQVFEAHARGDHLAAINVPCGTCRACCHGYEVEVTPDDDPSLETVPGVNFPHVLPKAPDGDACIHLVDGECAIYAKRPAGCRLYDCRQMFFAQLRGQREDINAAIEQWEPPNDATATDADRQTIMKMLVTRQIVMDAAPRVGQAADNVETIANTITWYVWKHLRDVRFEVRTHQTP